MPNNDSIEKIQETHEAAHSEKKRQQNREMKIGCILAVIIPILMAIVLVTMYYLSGR